MAFKIQPTEQLELDIRRLNITEDGVRPFYFPCRPDDIQEYLCALFEGCFNGLAALFPSRKEEVELALVTMVLFLREATSLFYCHVVARRALEDGVMTFSVPDSFSLFSAILNGQQPSIPESPAVKLLTRGIPDSPWRRPLRMVRNLMIKDEFCRVPPSFIDFKKSIITPSISPLIRHHARAVDRDVFVVPARYWFYPLPRDIIGKASMYALDKDIAEALLEGVARAYQRAGQHLENSERTYLRRWLEEVSGLCRLYLDRLLATPNKVPVSLWTGTGGIIWIRLLRLACRRLGGYVTGHEHGASSPVENIHLDIYEFVFCDRFITFTSDLARLYQKRQYHRFSLSMRAPKIESLSGKGLQREDSFETNIPKPLVMASKPVSKVMYMSTIYFGERPPLVPVFPDLVWVDWQARLIGLLRREGYDVLLKPHPEAKWRPGVMLERLASKVLWERFENVKNLADLYLFDWPRTTTLAQAVATNKPIIIIDFGFVIMEAEAEKCLRRRCAVVKGWVDNSGRAHVHRESLLEAFEDATTKAGDAEFFLRYQGGISGV